MAIEQEAEHEASGGRRGGGGSCSSLLTAKGRSAESDRTQNLIWLQVLINLSRDGSEVDAVPLGNTPFHLRVGFQLQVDGNANVSSL